MRLLLLWHLCVTPAPVPVGRAAPFLLLLLVDGNGVPAVAAVLDVHVGSGGKRGVAGAGTPDGRNVAFFPPRSVDLETWLGRDRCGAVVATASALPLRTVGAVGRRLGRRHHALHEQLLERLSKLPVSVKVVETLFNVSLPSLSPGHPAVDAEV